MKHRRLIVSPQAVRDLAEIVDWYRREMGSRAAARTARTLRAGFKAVTRISEEAARRDDLPPGYFRVVARAHLIIFQITGDEARIVRIIHGTRDVPQRLMDVP